MITRDGWRPLTGKKLYTPTEKEEPMSGRFGWEKDYAYWNLARRVEERFGPGGATSSDVYYEVTSKLGLSSSDTVTLLRNARAQGYLT